MAAAAIQSEGSSSPASTRTGSLHELGPSLPSVPLPRPQTRTRTATCWREVNGLPGQGSSTDSDDSTRWVLVAPDGATSSTS